MSKVGIASLRFEGDSFLEIFDGGSIITVGGAKGSFVKPVVGIFFWLTLSVSDFVIRSAVVLCAAAGDVKLTKMVIANRPMKKVQKTLILTS